jgi:lipoprotein-releasing system permease protein
VSLELFIALRYLRAKRKGIFATITSLIGVAGVTVGVAALITTLSVMNGFQTDIEQKIIGAQAHLTVLGVYSQQGADNLLKMIKADPDIAAAAPFVMGQAILNYENRSLGIVVKGLDPKQEFEVNNLAKTLRHGSWDHLSDGKVPGIVLGEELARNMGMDVGDVIVLVSPKSVGSALGMVPKMAHFKITGLLHTGYYEYDSTTGYVDLGVAAKFFGVEAGATAVGARLKDLKEVENAAARIQEKIGPAHRVRTYSELNSTLFAALKLEKGVMFLILTLIVLVASLNIASTLIMRSIEKTRDIGLLKAMGATPRQIKRIFLAEGFIIGGTGLAMGLGLGLLLCWIIRTFPIVQLPADIYYLSQVPVSIELHDVVAVLVMGLILSLLATVYPAARAAKVNPVEAIHYG